MEAIHDKILVGLEEYFSIEKIISNMTLNAQVCQVTHKESQRQKLENLFRKEGRKERKREGGREGSKQGKMDGQKEGTYCH